MHQALKNTISFSLEAGASITVPHGLALSGSNELRNVAPDIVFIPSPELSVLTTDTEITLTNNGGVLLEGTVLVEYWHSLERVFPDAGENLPTKPIIVVSAESGNAPPQSAFVSPPQVVTIYVRATGSDGGDGKTIPTAYRTVQRATLDIPTVVPGGVYYVIDATDLIDGGAEVFPPNYSLPVWKSSSPVGFAFDYGFPDPPLSVEAGVLGAVTLKATPRDVPTLGAEAIVEEDDLEATVVGTSIVSTTAGPITVTTLTPHKLVESPFGIFGLFEGFVQIVEISGAVDPAANGTFLGFVTKPTNDESTTFELWGFDFETETPFPIVGVGGGAGGTVTVPYVKDQRSGQLQVKVSAPRASWVPGSLKGKMLVDGSGDHGVIYDNTEDTLYLTHNRTSVSFAFGAARIMEQSCVLQCSDSLVFGRLGGFNVISQDSFAMTGIEVLPAPDGSSFYQLGGFCFVESCRLGNPTFSNVIPQAFVGNSYLINVFYDTCEIYQNRNLIENQGVFGCSRWSAFQGTVFIQNDSPLESAIGVIDWFGVKIISTTDPVLRIANVDSSITAVSIEGGAGTGDAIVVSRGACKLICTGGGGWPGTALTVDDGVQVEVDVFAFVKTDEMQVGLAATSLPARTFDSFRSLAPQFNQFDVTATAPGGGTGSRVFQRP